MADDGGKQPIIIKKIKKGGAGHHGGAWKVAYADFVTAMMALFLLLWMLNVATSEARQVISNYFDPAHERIAVSLSGAGGVLGGLSMESEGAMTDKAENLTSEQPTGVTGNEAAKQGQGGPENSEDPTEGMTKEQRMKELTEELRAQENARYEEAKRALEQTINENEELKDLADNIEIEITHEGLRIQIIDQEGKPLFPLGSALMFDYTRKLLEAVAKIILSMPNDISIRGHTDSYQYRPDATYTNWELSADRANASRRVLMSQGVPPERLADVMGKADREHYIKEDPFDERNRRISIILLRETLEQAILRGAFEEKLPENAVEEVKEEEPESKFNLEDLELKKDDDFSARPDYQKTPGNVYFP